MIIINIEHSAKVGVNHRSTTQIIHWTKIVSACGISKISNNCKCFNPIMFNIARSKWQAVCHIIDYINVRKPHQG